MLFQTIQQECNFDQFCFSEIDSANWRNKILIGDIIRLSNYNHWSDYQYQSVRKMSTFEPDLSLSHLHRDQIYHNSSCTLWRIMYVKQILYYLTASSHFQNRSLLEWNLLLSQMYFILFIWVVTKIKTSSWMSCLIRE